jgi:hypothetical protein
MNSRASSLVLIKGLGMNFIISGLERKARISLPSNKWSRLNFNLLVSRFGKGEKLNSNMNVF